MLSNRKNRKDFPGGDNGYSVPAEEIFPFGKDAGQTVMPYFVESLFQLGNTGVLRLKSVTFLGNKIFKLFLVGLASSAL